ncbi:hypothetical protein BDF20DRAFT_928072 [Mycotypha africana]|uniref:uncharacterized protein n=1 Tax=Mycotypha africana TaxID=64632 RepID=UPI002301DF76|nr:uncharacterized protein BDF20DRAFT_928072 [Mycotypha africana]KAI8967644.1 hypothetical protein BDF20DRAFT_928072 [Mycotypha africana]
MSKISTYNCILLVSSTLLLFSIPSYVVEALIPTPRYNGGCALLNQHIYCYGGTVNRQPSTDHYVFDLSNDFTIDSKTIDSWASAADSTNSYQLEPNSLFCMTALNDNTGYLIHGGLGYASSTQFLKNTTAIYNTTILSWQPLQQQIMNQSQIISSREGSCTLDRINRLWIWGGIRSVRYTKHLYLNTLTWSTLAKNTNATTAIKPRLAHTATLNEKTDQSIYYIGGLQNDGEHLLPSPMNEILEYQIQNDRWITHRSPLNTTVPSSRRLHTATWVPNSEDLIFVFGGSVIDGSSTVADYSYLLNITSFEWTPVNLTNTAATGAGSRFGHSAVLHKNNSLFILFGADQLSNLRNDFFVIDMSHWQTVTDFKVNGEYALIPVNNNTSSAPSSTIVNNGASSSRTKITSLAATSTSTINMCFGLSFFSAILISFLFKY